MASPDFPALQSRLEGTLMLPGQPGYPDARHVWNGLIDKYPSAIIWCTSAHDVQQGIAFARAHHFPIAVRGGGHSVAGYGTVDGGIVLDLSPMHEVTVDEGTRTVTVGGGATWGQVDAVTQEFGLAVPGGVFSRTGVGGLTLGGGYGWLRNMYGPSCMSLIAAEVVTADCAVVTTDHDTNSDLLWALRGGGGNMGVVTRFTFMLHPVGPEIYFLFVAHDARGNEGVRGLKAFRDFCADAPPEISAVASLGVVAEGADGFADDLVGIPFIGFSGLFVGDPARGAELLRPLHDFGTLLFDASGAMPYTAVQGVFDEDYPEGFHYYWKSLRLDRLDDEAIALIVLAGADAPSDLSSIDVWHMAGAARAQVDGALTTTDAPFLVNPEANWIDAHEDEANIDWARSFVSELEPFSMGTRYMNFAGLQEENRELMRASFGTLYERLARVKAQWDPQNVFRLNPNVPPKF
ncbi:FAD-binding oxidoreductase [Leifsonia sp. A12D58]|uniref:FAD-binding oxidoreductase n=1 Tax=Leifsonia sp. A12D58 TaxID=3397674 RepID=UPI0039E04AA9